MGGSSWNCELTQTFQIPVKYTVHTQFMAGSALLKNTISIEEWMTAAIFVK